MASSEDGSFEVVRQRWGQEEVEPLALELTKPAMYRNYTTNLQNETKEAHT